MTEQDPAEPQRREAIARLLDDIRAARAAGKEIDDATICESHRHLMPELGAELEKLRRIHAARRAAAAPPPPPPPADPTTEDLHIPTALINDLETPNIQVPGYSILREISRGGQAAVYLATQLSTGRKIALKLMHDGPFASDRAITRFRREVQALAALNHPNIVAIIDTGKTPEGARFIAMNYISGANLSDYMKDRLKKDPTDPSKLLRLFLKICDAVNAAHRLGIIHRDLKPSNIRVDERGEPHVLDFGLARTALDHALGTPDHAVSVTGEFLGSLPWSSPEQAEGSPDKIDIRTDVYSLGVILYQILTAGRFPYAVVGNIRDVLNNILTADPTPPSKILPVKQLDKTQNILPKHPLPSINETIEKIVLKALAKKPSERYQSAGELGRDIARYLAGQRTAAKEPERPGPSITPPKRPSITTMIAAATVILAVIILGLSLLHASHPLSPNLPTAPPASQPSLALNPSTDSTTTPSSIAATEPAAPPERRFPVYAFQGNGWKIQGDELVQTLSGKHQFLVFGDPAWSNYNFTFKALVDEDVRGGICPIFHWTEGNNYERFVIGAFEGTAFDFNYFTNGQQHRHPGDFLRAGFTYHHWYDVRIEVRGPEIRCLLDGVEYVHRTYNDYSSGRVGLEIYGCVSHFRDIRVVAPDGTLLLSGPPILPPESQSEALSAVDSSKSRVSTATPPSLIPLPDTTASASQPVITSTSAKPPSIPAGKTFTALADIVGPNDAQQFQIDSDGTLTVVDRQKSFMLAGTIGKDFVVSGEMYMDSGDDNQAPTGIKGGGRIDLCVRTTSGAYWLNGKSIGTNRVVEGQPIHQYREISHLGQPDGQWLPFRFEVTAAGIRAAVGTAQGEIKGPLSTDGQNYLRIAPGAKLRNLRLTILIPQLTNSLGMSLTLIPPGSFTMGTPDSEPGHRPNEIQHRVTLTKGFYMGTLPVTVAQYAAFAKESGYISDAEREGFAFVSNNGTFEQAPDLNWKNPGLVQNDDFPVIFVTWRDAVAFCHWLSKKEDRLYRLPTEAEWEYACRAGTTTQFNLGDGLAALDQGAWSAENSDHQPHAAGLKRPNAWGLYDMNGNVWQWCQDFRGLYPPEEVIDPQGPLTGNNRVHRGGAWFNFANEHGSGHRDFLPPDLRLNDDGFRVLLEVNPADTSPQLTPLPELFSPPDLPVLHIDASGVITVDQIAELHLRNVAHRNFILTGEVYMDSVPELLPNNAPEPWARNNGGFALYTRSTDALHEYELSGKGVRAKRVLLDGHLLDGISQPPLLNLPDHQWIPFRFDVADTAIRATVNGQSVALNGPLSTDGDTRICLIPGAKLRNLFLASSELHLAPVPAHPDTPYTPRPSNFTLARDALAAIFGPNNTPQFDVAADGTITVDRFVKATLLGTEDKSFTISGDMYMDSGDGEPPIPSGVKNGGRIDFTVRESAPGVSYRLNGKYLGASGLIEGKPTDWHVPVHLNQPDHQWLPFRFEVTAAAIQARVGTASGELPGPLSAEGSSNMRFAPGAKLRNLSLTIR